MARYRDKFIDDITGLVIDAITSSIEAAQNAGFMSWHFTHTNEFHMIAQATLKCVVDNGNRRPMSVMDTIRLTDAEVVNFLNDLGYVCERAVDGGILIKWE